MLSHISSIGTLEVRRSLPQHLLCFPCTLSRLTTPRTSLPYHNLTTPTHCCSTVVTPTLLLSFLRFSHIISPALSPLSRPIPTLISRKNPSSCTLTFHVLLFHYTVSHFIPRVSCPTFLVTPRRRCILLHRGFSGSNEQTEVFTLPACWFLLYGRHVFPAFAPFISYTLEQPLPTHDSTPHNFQLLTYTSHSTTTLALCAFHPAPQPTPTHTHSNTRTTETAQPKRFVALPARVYLPLAP
jgi:hypothetical protein